MTETTTTRPDVATNPYLAVWQEARDHQAAHDPSSYRLLVGGPTEYCYQCVRDDPASVRRMDGPHEIKLRYSWAIPNDDALTAIAEHSPNGVVEIGAGGGYWAGLLRSRGVDVVAYDPDPDGGTDEDVTGERSRWHDGTRWSDVTKGDHRAVTAHDDRTLLLVWPSYDWAWTDEVLDLYAGDTVIYVGEGSGGCTGTDRMHNLLGNGTYCWHDGEACDCDRSGALFREVADVEIPQWSGLHDRLRIYKRAT